jgi:hypothetical protein
LAQNGCDSILKIDIGSKFVKAGIAIDTSNSPTVQFFSTSTNANFWKWNFGDLKSSVHCCPKRFSSITNFIDFTGRKGYKNAFCDFDPSFI